MTHECAVCSALVDPLSAEPYRFGAVAGVVCLECARTLGVALTRWMRQRQRDMAAERVQAEKLERARAAKDASLRRARDADAQRMTQLELETMPIARSGTRGNRSSAA